MAADREALEYDIVKAAVALFLDEENLGRQIIRESMGLSNWAKKAYSCRRKSRMDLSEATKRYLAGCLANIEQLAATLPEKKES